MSTSGYRNSTPVMCRHDYVHHIHSLRLAPAQASRPHDAQRPRTLPPVWMEVEEAQWGQLIEQWWNN